MENNMSEIPINQKEYLKKYLGIGKAPGEKKKKKKRPIANSRVQIIDDDADANAPAITIEKNTIIIDEDAPQIVAIIDERPPSLRVDEKTKNPLWQPIGTVEDVRNNEPKQTIKGFKIGTKNIEKTILEPPKRKSKQKSDDYSPARKSRKEETVVIKEERKSESPRRSAEREFSSPRMIKQEKSPDISPPRRNRRDSDISPPRKSKRDDDVSPPRRIRRDDDISPPRRHRKDDSSLPRRTKNDNSPPRRRRKDEDVSPPRKARKNNDTNSPPRKNRQSGFEDNSPSTKNKKKDSSPVKRKTRFDNSPPRKASSSKKLDKTLDGKTAGLQNARELIEETQNFHKRENKLFNSLGKEVSGENAETVFRDRKSGRIRNLDEEEEKQRKKREEDERNKEKYERWGRGLAQVESREQKIQEELHEMSKPLARYADDEDLEKYLKEQEREGDPMLAYIRKKKRKKAVERGEEIKPQFEGEFMPNRYGIRPGHRWDGVDRSNGYEKKWFEVQNAKKALLEDSYKWSTEDM